MLRRLFYLFPDEAHAQRLVEQLGRKAVEIKRIHAICRGVELKTLPKATVRQLRDGGFRLERVLWLGNLFLFAFSLIAFVALLFAGEMLLSTVPLVVLIFSFWAGEHFVVCVPRVHLHEFSDALSRGEILLMIDVPRIRVTEIDEFVHRYHPEAVTGGIGWTLGCFGF